MIRFPYYLLGSFLLCLAVTVPAWSIALNCPTSSYNVDCDNFRHLVFLVGWLLVSTILVPTLFFLFLGRLGDWNRRNGDAKPSARFPVYSVGFLVFFLLLTMLVSFTAKKYCRGGFGNFQCDQWVTPFTGFVFAWEILRYLVIPVAGLVALVRLVQWLLARRKLQAA